MAYYELPPEDDQDASQPEDGSDAGSDATPTWGDYLDTLAAGGYQGLASLSSGVRALGEHSGSSPDDQAVASIGKDLADVFHDYSDEDLGELTPAMKDRLGAAVTSEDFWEHPFSAVAAKSTEMAGGLVPIAGAGAIASLTPAGPFVDAAVTSLASGAMTAAQTVDSMYQFTDSLRDDQLQKESKYYAGLRSSGVPEKAARQDLNNEMQGYAPYYAFALGTIGGWLGPVGQFMRDGTGVTGRLAGAATGAAEAAAGNAAMGGVNYAEQQNEVSEGLRPNIDVSELVNAVLEPAVVGAVQGGLTGGLLAGKRAKPTEEPEPTSENAVEPETNSTSDELANVNDSPSTGLATTAQRLPATDLDVGNPQSAPERSETNYGKTKRARGKGAQTVVADDGLVAPDQSAALSTETSATDEASTTIATAVDKLSQEPPKATSPDEVTPEVTPESNQTAATPPAPTPTPSANPEVDQTLNAVAPRPEPGVPQPIPPQRVPQILEDVKNRAAMRAQNKRVQDNLARLQQGEEPAVPKPGHRTKAELAARQQNQALAENIYQKYAPSGVENDARRLQRAGAAVSEFEQAGGKIPDRLKGKQSPEITWLREAKDYVNAGENGTAPNKAHLRFHTRESVLRAGDDVSEDRRVEGSVAKAVPKTDVERVAAPEGTANYNPEHQDMGAVETASARGPVRGVHDYTEVTPEGKERAKAASPVRKIEITPEMRAKYEHQGVHKSVHALPDEEGAAPNTEVHAPGLFPSRTVKVRDVASRIAAGVDELKLTGVAREIYKHMAQKLVRAVGDVPIHIVSDAELQKASGATFRAAGIYRPTHHDIVVADKLLEKSPEFQAHTLLHEMVHAATVKAIYGSEVATRQIRALMDHVERVRTQDLWWIERFQKQPYGLSNEVEFIAEAMSNPEFQKLLQQTKLTPELAKMLGIENWHKYTTWDALVQFVRRALGLLPHETNALEAAMSLTERTMLEHIPEDLATYMGRVGADRRAIAERLAATRQPKTPEHQPEQQIHALRLDADELISRARNFTNRPDAGAKLKSIGRALITNDQYAQQVGKLLPHARPIFETLEQQGAYAGKLKQQGNKLVSDMIRAYQKAPEAFSEWAKLVNDQTMFGVDASSPIGDGRNEYLALSKKNAAKEANGTLTTSDLPIHQWEAHDAHPELQDRFNKLVAKNPEFRGLQERLFQSFDEAQQEMARGHIETLLRSAGLDEPTRQKRAGEILEAKNGEEFQQALSDEFGDAFASHILSAKRLSGKEGPYAPLMRHGDHVVSGTYKVAEPTNAIKKTSPDTWEFKDRQAAYEFGKKTGLHYTAKPIYYDKESGERTTKVGGVSTTGEPEQRWEVRVQRHHVEFHDRLKDAQARQKVLHESGLFEKEPYIEKKREWLQRASNNALGAGALHTIMDRLAKTDEYNRATPSQKAEMRNALQEAATVTMAGNRIQSRRLPRRRVQGASEDLLRNMHVYTDSVSNYRAKVRFRPQIDDLITAAHEFVEAHRYLNNDELDPQGFARSEAFNEVEKRARAQDPEEYTGAYSAAARKIMTLDYIDRMMRASHLILHQTHLPMITAPTIAGRHGLMRTYTMMAKTWKKALGAYGEGLNDVKGSIIDRLHEATDYGEFFKKAFAGDVDAARLAQMFDKAAETNALHPQSGLEVGKYVPSSQVRGKFNPIRVADQAAMRMDTVFRHATNATEAVNRYVGATMAYRLEYSKLLRRGYNPEAAHAGATEYAIKTIKNTQGLYSSTNAAPLFKIKWLRPFLQFKQFPQMMYHLLISNAKTVLKGATREERIEAASSLLYVLGAHVLMTGMLGGLPLEPLKVAALITKGLGITSGDWSDFERWQREEAVKYLGKEGADYLMEGVARHAFGVDLHHRLGLNSFFTFGLPDKLDAKEVSAYLFDQALGAPEGLAADTFEGINQMMSGDIEHGATKAIPLQSLRDIQKAWEGGTDKYQYSPAERVGRALGFTPAGEAEAGDRAHEMKQISGEYTDQRRSLMSGWASAASADKAKAWAKIQAWNAEQPTKEARITMSQLQSAAKRRSANEKTGNNYKGVSLNRQTKFIADRDRELYPN